LRFEVSQTMAQRLLGKQRFMRHLLCRRGGRTESRCSANR
jgi:hypothetical protein